MEEIQDIIKVEENKHMREDEFSPEKPSTEKLEFDGKASDYDDIYDSSETPEKLFDLDLEDLRKNSSNTISMPNSLRKNHYSDDEIDLLRKHDYKREKLEKLCIRFEDLCDKEYTSKCMFCKGIAKRKEADAKKIQKVSHKAKSIFDKNSSSSSKVAMEEIRKLYQDLSVDDPRTSFNHAPDVIQNNLELKYLTSREYYNTKIVNDVIYNENTHIVSVFKDYLIFDDVSEFLKRHYTTVESKKRLPKVIEFYETYSKVFPNYVNIPENKFMFKNIERKQLYWDSKQQFLMEQEERNSKKKARIEDFGGVQNAPSSFFNESMEDKLFTNSFVEGINKMDVLPDLDPSFDKIVTVKNDYDSRVLDISHQKEEKKSVAKQLEALIKGYTEKDSSGIFTKSVLELSILSKQMSNESFFSNKINDPDISNFFKESIKKEKEKEVASKPQPRNCQLHQYEENRIHPGNFDYNNFKRTQKIMPNQNAIDLISNHYNGKAKTTRQHTHFEKSTKPNSDNKVIVNSGTLIKHLRTTDSSEFCNGTRTRELSDKKLSKPSPFLRMRDKKCSSQINLKPKLKIVKSKEPKKVYMKNIKNPFKKGRKKDFDYSSKISGISPNSRLKTSEIYKDKKGRRKGSQKRSTSYISNKSQGRSKNSLPDEGKCIKAFLSNYYSKNSRKSHKNSMKNLINKEAIVSYKDVAKNLEIIKKIERKIKDKDFKNLKNLVKDSEAEAFLISARKDSKQKTSFHRPSLSVCFDNGNTMDSCRRKSKRKTRKGCKERKGSANKKNISSHKKFTLANTTNMQHENDRMKKIFEMVQSTSSTFKPGSFHNENIFKAIQSRMINSKGPKSKTKENGTPKSSKKKSGPFTQRTSSLKGPVAVSGYSTTAFSPREYNQIRKEREQIYSPTSMKSMTKKKGSKSKNSTSKKRDSVGNLSKHFEDFTMYSTKGKQFKNNSSIVKNSSRGHTRSSFIHSHKRTSSRTSEIYNSGGSRKRKSKRTSTLISKDVKSNSNISFIKKNQKTIFKILNSNNKLNKIVPTIPSKSDRLALGCKGGTKSHRSSSNDRYLAQGHKANSHRRKYCTKKGNEKGHKTQNILDSCLGNNRMAKYIMTQRDVPLGNFLNQLQEKEC